MDKVTFDYSRAEAFINPHEVAYMGRLAEDARKLLLSREGAAVSYTHLQQYLM